ncbi:host attachment family protein [Lichenihabitans sp. Uapishka_5]|uniref:host attachment family protein n=1 Tax=Lichenihabitans sp. Uapishka_5 TaxID=3037302 RepID=UPI0029E7F92F|nr:host attachment family protein [Lichenihabitans sp. Uapishka_5]MDX7952734.1 host attachment family protein [Lichenihabitans sp. Uapishka_5]
METFTVRHGAWVVIGDGKKALVLHNEGDAELLNLRRVSVRENHNPATRQQGSDAPGRSSSPAGAGSSSIAGTDWHQIEEDRFAASLADDINTAARGHLFKDLIVVAPPKTLAELRKEFGKDTQKCIVGELAKDYTHHTIPEIESLLLTHRPQ